MNNYFLDNKLTYDETPKMRWFHGKEYKIEGDIILPEDTKKPTEYYPFELYEGKDFEKKYSKSPHQKFANIDLSDNKNIIKFYNSYGPLGLYNRDVIKLVTHNPQYSGFRSPGDTSFFAVLRNPITIKEGYNSQTSNILEFGMRYESWELVPFNYIVLKYNIPKHVYEGLSSTDSDNIESQLPWLYINPCDISESLEDFKRECSEFKFLMEINSILKKIPTDIDKLRLILKSKGYKFEENNSESIIFRASSLIWGRAKAELSKTVSPALSWDESKYKLSNDVDWECDSLLAAMYLMLLLDRTISNFNKRCVHCKKWFYSDRLDAAYCSGQCKSSQNKEDQKYKNELTRKDEVMELLKLGSPVKEVWKITRVRKKTIEKWISEVEMKK